LRRPPLRAKACCRRTRVDRRTVERATLRGQPARLQAFRVVEGGARRGRR
jgi:hypothetical protein